MSRVRILALFCEHVVFELMAGNTDVRSEPYLKFPHISFADRVSRKPFFICSFYSTCHFLLQNKRYLCTFQPRIDFDLLNYLLVIFIYFIFNCLSKGRTIYPELKFECSDVCSIRKTSLLWHNLSFFSSFLFSFFFSLPKSILILSFCTPDAETLHVGPIRAEIFDFIQSCSSV